MNKFHIVRFDYAERIKDLDVNVMIICVFFIGWEEGGCFFTLKGKRINHLIQS